MDHLLNTVKGFKNGKLDKTVFVGDAAYSGISDKALKDRAYEIAINPNYDGYIGGLESMVYKFPDKKKALLASVLAQELHKPVIKKSSKSLCQV